MNDILKKERLKKIRIILIILVALILIPTGTYFTITSIKDNKKEPINDEQVNNNDITPTYSDDVVDFENINLYEVLSGTWYSCDNEDCYGFTYDKEENHTIFGLVLSDALFDGYIKEINKLSDYRYELLIHHPKFECSDFGKITDDECNKMCSELLCDEEFRTYQVDIRDIAEKKIYIKVMGIENYFDKFTSFDNSLGISVPYDDNHKVLERFKNNVNFLEE